jgi:hypothetical protein
MKYFISLLFVLLMGAGCKQKPMTEAQVENKLKKTMNDYLGKDGKSNVVFTVKDVIYYSEKEYYYCEFKVSMRADNKDSTGTMTAIISSDFSTVERSQ